MGSMNLKLKCIVAAAITLAACGVSRADTFTDTKSGQVLHGYVTGKGTGAVLHVATTEKGVIDINRSQWKIARDAQGRKNKVVVLAIDGAIEYECETKALEKAIAKASADGVQFILLEVDTPGGRVDLAREICAAIDSAGCDVVVFIKGGSNGGAISAGAAVSLAANKIYIARGAVFGGATLVAMEKDHIADVNTVMGADVGAKMSSIWQGMMASMAEKHGRSGVIARAMVSRDIGVVEVSRGGASDYVEPQNVQPGDKVIKRWSDRRRLVTLTGEEAVKSGMADGLAESRQEVLDAMKAGDFEVVEDRSPQTAAEQFKLAQNRSAMLVRNINAKMTQLQKTETRAVGMKLIREIKNDMGQLILLAKANPDLHLDTASMEAQYAHVEQAYKAAVRD